MTRAAGGGSGAWGHCVGVFGFVISGRLPKDLKSRFSGQATEGDGSPLKAGCRRVVTHLPGQGIEKVDDMPGLAP
ncbi:hypothetical protein D3C80_1589960 [compost metagenome]